MLKELVLVSLNINLLTWRSQIITFWMTYLLFDIFDVSYTREMMACSCGQTWLKELWLQIRVNNLQNFETGNTQTYAKLSLCFRISKWGHIHAYSYFLILYLAINIFQRLVIAVIRELKIYNARLRRRRAYFSPVFVCEPTESCQSLFPRHLLRFYDTLT